MRVCSHYTTGPLSLLEGRMLFRYIRLRMSVKRAAVDQGLDKPNGGGGVKHCPSVALRTVNLDFSNID